MIVSEAEEAKCGGTKSIENNGGISHEATDAANACCSFWEGVGREAGAKGVRLSAGLAQQAGVEQCLESQPLQQQLDFAPPTSAPVPAETVETLFQTRTNPSRMTTTIFTTRDVMASSWSFGNTDS
jgi:hypothetical protein